MRLPDGLVRRNMQWIDAGEALARRLADYRQRWPDEGEVHAQFQVLLGDPANPFVRERLAGHFTASSWLVDRRGERVLLTHHRKLDRWLQLGGHADGDRDLAQVALREAEEESGLAGLRVEPAIFDLDRHWIPERGDVPGHWHYDARYVVHAGEDEAYVVSDESHDLAWRDIARIAADESADESLRRMARKWQERVSRG
jgi:8-oxo-dGTP pyrophosphatase MutT (NUDIX family)